MVLMFEQAQFSAEHKIPLCSIDRLRDFVSRRLLSLSWRNRRDIDYVIYFASGNALRI